MNFIKKTTRPAFFRILKLTSLCLSFILGLFYTYSSSEGRIYGACRPHYYKVSGTIHTADSTHRPLKGIEVELQAYPPGNCEVTVAKTDSTGYYATSSALPTDGRKAWVLHADGKNSNYLDKDTIFPVPTDSTYDSTSGQWCRNKEKTVDLEMEKE